MPCVNRSGCESRRKSSEKVFCDGDQESPRELSLLVSLLTLWFVDRPEGLPQKRKPERMAHTLTKKSRAKQTSKGQTASDRARKAAANAGLPGPGKRPQ